MELALWADMRVVAEYATVASSAPFWACLDRFGNHLLPRLIGHSQAIFRSFLILTGRPVGRGGEPIAWGTGNRLVAIGEPPHAIALAKEIARFPQNCMRADPLSALFGNGSLRGGGLANKMRGGLEVIASGETRRRDALCVVCSAVSGAFGLEAASELTSHPRSRHVASIANN